MWKKVFSVSLILSFLSQDAMAVFSFTRTITVDSTKCGSSGSQANFPVLVSITDNTFKTVGNSGNIQNANGYDIAFFSDASLTTPLNFQIERYDGTAGEYIAWVNAGVGSSQITSASNAVIYIAYGDSGISSSQENVSATWNSNYRGVWHMRDGTTFSGADSTSNGANSSNNNGTTAAVGQMDGAGSFNGTSNWLAIGSNISGLTGNVTFSGWMYVASFPGIGLAEVNQMFYYNNNAATDYGYLSLYSPAGTINLNGGFYPGGETNWAISGWSINTWHHIAMVYNGSTVKLYFDGGEVASGAATSSVPGAQSNFQIGAADIGIPGRFWDGRMDEARASDTNRTADWILTEYNNQFNPGTFYTLGAETPFGTPQRRRTLFFKRG